MRRAYGILFALAVAAAFGLWTVAGERTSATGTTATGARATAGTETVAFETASETDGDGSRWLRRYERGMEYVYQVSYAQEIRAADAGDAGIGGFDYQLVIGGELRLAPVAITAEEVLLRAELGGAAVSVRSQGRELLGENARRMARELGQPHYLHLSRTGRIRSAEFPSAMQASVRDSLATVHGLFQVALPVAEREPPPAWQAEESAAQGEFAVAYRVDDDSVLTRQRVRLLRVATAAGVAAPEEAGIRIVRSQSRMTPGRGGWPDRVDGSEELALGQPLAATSIASWTAQSRGARRSNASDERAAGAYALHRWSAAATSERLARASDSELIDGATFADLLAELAELGDDRRARAYQYERMAALFRNDAAAVGEAALALGDLEEDPAAMVVGALGEAGTPEAQKVLAEMVGRDDCRDDRCAQATAMLGLMDAPEPEVIDALARAAEDNDDDTTAELALGNAGRRGDAAASNRALSVLRARLAGASGEEELIAAIRALGNLGSGDVLSLLSPYLGVASPAVRAAAYEALRLLPQAEALSHLYRAVGADRSGAAADPSGSVRRAAAFALGHRDDVGDYELLARAFASESVEAVRIELVTVFARAAAADPYAGAVLDSAVADASEGVRQAASAAKRRLALELASAE